MQRVITVGLQDLWEMIIGPTEETKCRWIGPG